MMPIKNGFSALPISMQWSTLEVFHDLKSRRYIAMGLDNEEGMYDSTAVLQRKSFTPSALKRNGRR